MLPLLKLLFDLFVLTKMKIILQHDLRDCGSACLSMISSYYGLNISVAKSRELTQTDKDGTNLYGITKAANDIGFISEAYLCSNTDELIDALNKREITCPFIAHIISDDYFYHFIVITHIKNNNVYVCDPAKGKMKLPLEQFQIMWTGYIATFKKGPLFPKIKSDKKSILKQLLSYLKGQKANNIIIILCSLLVSGISIAGAFVFQIVIDSIISYSDKITDTDKILHFFTKGNIVNLSTLFGSLIGLYLLQALIHFFRSILIAHVYTILDKRIFLSFFDHLSDLPISSIKVRKTGEYMSRFSDIDTIRESASNIIVTLFLDSVIAIFVGLILINININLFLISVPALVIYIILVGVYKKHIENSNREVMENDSIINSWLKESIDGIETIKATNSHKYIKKSTVSKYSTFIKVLYKNAIISSSQDVLINVIDVISKVLILWAGFSFSTKNNLSIGSVITFYALLSYFTEPIKNLVELQPLIQRSGIALERLNDIFSLKIEQYESGDSIKDFDNLKIENVNFRYGNKPLLLKDINLELKKGDIIALVGESGSGKSTLAKLLLRFYEYESGKISINNHNIKAINLLSLRDLISYVPQDVFLFADTIKNNLTLGDKKITDADIDKACEAVKANDFISTLPMGYNTYLSENGMNLSGGQRQRLALARAILKKPQILILDESTSNLDQLTEKYIRNRLFNKVNNLTVIIIANKLSIVKDCNKIYVLDKGEIVEEGTHAELIEKSGKYSALWNSQN